MSDIHFDVFSNNLVKCIFRHRFYLLQFVREVFRKAEGEAIFADGLGADLTGKIIETTEEVTMYLLQTLITVPTSIFSIELLSNRKYAWDLLLSLIVSSLLVNHTQKRDARVLGKFLARRITPS